jgi:hypothetical protein
LESVIYLYPSEKAAKNGDWIGGSGFLVGFPSEDAPDKWGYIYAVTNRHVVENAQSRTLRINTRDGKVDIISTDFEDWTCSTSDDLAVTMVNVNREKHKFSHVDATGLIDQTVIDQLLIGPGDEVFMPGRLISHDGRQTNTPCVRFGNISMMPQEPVLREDGSNQDSFLVDMRSISGYSGSPAFVFIPPSDWPSRRLRLHPDENRRLAKYWLLGVDWGNLPLWTDVVFKADKQTRHPDELGVNSHSGLAGVVPAWKLRELLNERNLILERRELDAKFAAEQA